MRSAGSSSHRPAPYERNGGQKVRQIIISAEPTGIHASSRNPSHFRIDAFGPAENFDGSPMAFAEYLANKVDLGICPGTCNPIFWLTSTGSLFLGAFLFPCLTQLSDLPPRSSRVDFSALSQTQSLLGLEVAQVHQMMHTAYAPIFLLVFSSLRCSAISLASEKSHI
jgi:hypothetical protein